LSDLEIINLIDEKCNDNIYSTIFDYTKNYYFKNDRCDLYIVNIDRLDNVFLYFKKITDINN